MRWSKILLVDGVGASTDKDLTFMYSLLHLFVCLQYNILVLCFYYTINLFIYKKCASLGLIGVLLIVMWITFFVLFLMPIIANALFQLGCSVVSFFQKRDPVEYWKKDGPTVCLYDWGIFAEEVSGDAYWTDYSPWWIYRDKLRALQKKYSKCNFVNTVVKSVLKTVEFLTQINYVLPSRFILKPKFGDHLRSERTFFFLIGVNLVMYCLLYKVVWVVMTLYVAYTSNPGRAILFCTGPNKCHLLMSDMRLSMQRVGTRDFTTYHTKVRNNLGDFVPQRHYVKEIGIEDKSLLEAGHELKDKFLFSSHNRHGGGGWHEVSHRLDGANKDQYVQQLFNEDAILERGRTLEKVKEEESPEYRKTITENVDKNLFELGWKLRDDE